MAGIEYRVLTEILKDKSLEEPLKLGLETSHFKDPEAQQIYDYIYNHWFAPQTTRTVPSIQSIRRQWTSFKPTDRLKEESSELKPLIHELKMKSFSADARTLANYFQEVVTEGTADDQALAVKAMKNHLDDLVYRLHGSNRITLAGMADMAKRHYRLAQAGSNFGIPWPWQPLTEDTRGKNAGEFTVFYGRMKSMKTWLLLYCAAMDFLLYNQRVLIWSREMNEEQISLRLASILARVDYQLFKKGRLPKRLENRMILTLEELTQERLQAQELKAAGGKAFRDITILAGRGTPKLTTELQGAIMEYQPTVVYLDSFYHLHSSKEKESSQRWSRIATIAEEVKSMAQDNGIPIVATHQANRDGEKNPGGLMDLADSDVIAREADLVIRILKRKGHALHEDEYEVELARQKQLQSSRPRLRIKASQLTNLVVPKKAMLPEQMQQTQSTEEGNVRVGAEIMLIVGGNREGVLEGFTIHAIPGYNFKIIQSYCSSDDVKKWVEIDDEEAVKETDKFMNHGQPRKQGVDVSKISPDAFRKRGRGPVNGVRNPMKA